MIARRIGMAGLFVAFSLSLAAQTFQFQLIVTQGQDSISIQNGSLVTLAAPVGQSQTAQLQATYLGAGKATISTQPNLFGSAAFKATIIGTLPAQLGPGASVVMTISFTPTAAGATIAQLQLPFVETLPNVSATNGAITVALQGTTPSFVLSYELQTDQNVIPLNPGGLIAFPVTLAGTVAQASLNLTNRGSGSGAVSAISITGAAFRLQGIPLLPATVAPNQTIAVVVIYAPTGIGSDTGQITINLAGSPPIAINLTGNGTSPNFSYAILTAPPAPVSPGGTISFADAQMGQSTTATIQIVNSGNAAGTLNSLIVAGQGFSLSDAPVLPKTLAVGASVTFTITFSPTQPGAATAVLIVNADTFKLSGVGLGPLLTYSYVAGGAQITLGGANPSVVFTPLPVTQSEQVSFDIRNSGTLPATISSIGVGQSAGPFTLAGLPNLPLTLAPGEDSRFTVKFTPISLGFSNGTLLIDAATVTLVGSGMQPPPLPSYAISGPSAGGTPMTQPSISLDLASPYPVAISGSLTIGIVGDLPVDPAVQFATGGRTVAFVIPANQTSAVFGLQGPQIGIQTGTVAETITLTPTFATQSGNVDITPSTPPSLQFAVAPSAPTLIAMEISSVTTSGFTIQVTGFSTTRSLTSAAVQFTPATGFSMPTSQFTMDLSQLSTLWFQSAASQAYGGLFMISIPFTFQGSLAPGQSVFNAIASVAVKMSNSIGASNSVQAALQ